MSKDKVTYEKKEFKSYEDLHAWKTGQDLSVQLETMLQEWRDDTFLREWCQDLSLSLRDAMVQIMEAFYKYTNADKVKRYEAALFYTHRLAYTLRMGETLGWWQAGELHQAVEDWAKVIKQTRYHFIERGGKNLDKSEEIK